MACNVPAASVHEAGIMKRERREGGEEKKWTECPSKVTATRPFKLEPPRFSDIGDSIRSCVALHDNEKRWIDMDV